MNGLTAALAASDDPTDNCRDQTTPLLTDNLTREWEESSQASISRGVLNTQPRLSNLSPSLDAPQLAPRQAGHRIGASRKRTWSQPQDPSTATNGLDSVVGVESSTDGLVR